MDREVVGEAIATLLEAELEDEIDAICTAKTDSSLPYPIEYEYAPVPITKDGVGPYLWVTDGDAVPGEDVGAQRSLWSTDYEVHVAWRHEGSPQDLMLRRNRYTTAVTNVIDTYMRTCIVTDIQPFDDSVVRAWVVRVEAGDPLSKGHEDASVCTIRVQYVE